MGEGRAFGEELDGGAKGNGVLASRIYIHAVQLSLEACLGIAEVDRVFHIRALRLRVGQLDAVVEVVVEVAGALRCGGRGRGFVGEGAEEFGRPLDVLA